MAGLACLESLESTAMHLVAQSTKNGLEAHFFVVTEWLDWHVWSRWSSPLTFFLACKNSTIQNQHQTHVQCNNSNALSFFSLRHKKSDLQRDKRDTSMSTMIMECLSDRFELVCFTTSYRFLILTVATLIGLYFLSTRRASIYMLDFTCYRPPKSNRQPMSKFLEILHRQFDPDSVAFQIKILEKSGFSDETCLPHTFAHIPIKKTFSFSIEEATTVMFSMVEDLLNKHNIKPKEIDILISNNSLFAPAPSLTAIVVNRFKMRSNVRSFNLSGMGCSAGLISVGLAKDLLRLHPNSLALILSTEMLNLNWYSGKNPSMLITNCLFRMGGAAILMSSRNQDRKHAKYELQQLLRSNKSHDDRCYNCVIQDIDSEGSLGISISKTILHVAAEVLKLNISTLGPKVLPFSEQLRYLISVIQRKMKISGKKGLYMPKFRRTFKHFCIHAGGKAVIQRIGQALELSQEEIEASKMTLYRYGNTSSSSLWYELSYIEAKGRMKKGDKVWQIAFGSGFKCNSAVWKCLHNVGDDVSNPWREDIHQYPVEIPDIMKIN